MKMKNKVVLVKVYILLCWCWIIALLYVMCRVEWGINPEWENLAHIMLVVFLCLAVLMVYFVSKVDLYPRPLNVKPSIKMLNVSCFEDFKNQLFQDAKQEGFCDMKIVESDNNMETMLAFKCEKRVLTILQTIWMDEFDEDILRKMTDLFWEETEKKIGRRRIQKYVVQLIQCICVGRMDDQANEFVHRNLPQNIGQYQSLNVISFDERLVYICQTDYKYFDKAFRRVENLFLKITKDILI